MNTYSRTLLKSYDIYNYNLCYKGYVTTELLKYYLMLSHPVVQHTGPNNSYPLIFQTIPQTY